MNSAPIPEDLDFFSATSGQAELRQAFINLKRRNAELAEENSRLVEAVAARDAFLAVAAHELRNPMTPIALRAQILRQLMKAQPAQDIRIEQHLDVIDRSIAAFVRRAGTLLDVSRITSGTLALAQEPVDIVDVARAVVDDMALLSVQLDAPLELAAPDTPVCVVGDALAIQQILENLISNGIKYGQSTRVVIGITTEHGMGVIRVSDSGDGISAGNQARIFERFERVAGSGHHAGGFGVGLWLVRQLSDAMGGDVAVTSSPGAGSTFRVELPLHQLDDRA
ncbi:MAG: HAMP domain-containing histidine kinase [Pseudomonadota bacterium]|nr:HAMP domain-containing histidine kinase [Pseudomonadota bacterium]